VVVVPGDRPGSVLSPLLPEDAAIPLAAIVAICASILLLLGLLLCTVCYCMRQRHFKLCKSLLQPSAQLSVSEKTQHEHNSFSAIISVHDPADSKAQLNKTFVSVDIASISAPIPHNDASSSASCYAGLSVVNGSMTSSSLTTSSQRQQQQRLVVEDCSKKQQQQRSSCDLSKSSNSTAVSNCSSLNTKYQHNEMYTEFYAAAQTTNTASNNSSTNSNSDPIVVDNSLSSSHSSSANNSPTYGYNVANAALTQTADESSDNLLYIKTGINSKCFSGGQQQDSGGSSGYTSNKSSESNTPPQSGYSTPARLKKVVYEVIV